MHDGESSRKNQNTTRQQSGSKTMSESVSEPELRSYQSLRRKYSATERQRRERKTTATATGREEEPVQEPEGEGDSVAEPELRS